MAHKALTDGYTRRARRPSTAAAGFDMLPEEEAARFDRRNRFFTEDRDSRVAQDLRDDDWRSKSTEYPAEEDDTPFFEPY